MFKFLKRLFRKKDVVVPFYVVVDIEAFEDSLEPDNLLKTPFVMNTITSKSVDAWEYIWIKAKKDNYEHFFSWCQLKDLNINNNDSFIEYVNNNPSIIDKYKVLKITYSTDSLAMFLRTMNDYKPIGASYESGHESMTAIIKELDEIIEELGKDLLEEEPYGNDDDDFDTSLN